MSSDKRTTLTAVLASVAACAFLYSLIALLPGFVATVRGDPSHDNVAFTFQSYECVNTAYSTETCRWYGTITENGSVVETDVAYGSEPPAGVATGMTVPALWSFHDPFIAWDIDSTRSWLGTIATTVVTAVMFIALTTAAALMWRRVRRDSSSARAVATSDDRRELTHSSG